MTREPAFDDALLSRIEDAGINASAPREQRWVDGWLLRTAPGKAKRARCVQAVAAGTGPIDGRLARCLAAFREAGLPAFVRVTPFSLPKGLDAHLAALGMDKVDDTVVMVADVDRLSTARAGEITAIELDAYARWIGSARGSTPLEIASDVDRMAGAPVDYRAFVIRDADDRIDAGGQIATEDDIAGIYGVFTLPDRRRQGLGERLCRGLACAAAQAGVRSLYLQVEATNAPALRLYRRLGFAEAYRYHYRTPAAALA